MKIGVGTTLVAIATGLILVTGCEKTMRVTADSTTGVDVGTVESREANAGLTRDALVAARVTQALKHDPTTDDAAIYVSVSQGRARLSGFVDTAAERLRAGVLALATDGVDKVDNRLILRYHADLSQNPLGGARVRL